MSDSGLGLRARSLKRGVWERFERLWLDRASEPGAVAEIESGLDAKLENLGERSEGYREQLKAAVEQARKLWDKRDQLTKREVMYVGAALLYFLSPIDGIPDLIPGIGFADDLIVVTTVLGMVLKAVSTGGDLLQARAEQVVEKAEAAADRAADNLVPRSIASIAIGLWGATTAAGLSLATAIAVGGVASEWIAYVAAVAAFAIGWNTVSALSFLREFRSLSDPVRERLIKIFASKLDWRHAVILTAPILAMAALAVLRVWLG